MSFYLPGARHYYRQQEPLRAEDGQKERPEREANAEEGSAISALAPWYVVGIQKDIFWNLV